MQPRCVCAMGIVDYVAQKVSQSSMPWQVRSCMEEVYQNSSL